MLSLSDFRLTRSRSLSIGGWQPSRRRRRFHYNRRRLLKPTASARLARPIQKNVYASAIGLCKGLYAVKETVEPGLLAVLQRVADPTRVRTLADKNSAVTLLDLRPTVAD